jgi:hypothetical protein
MKNNKESHDKLVQNTKKGNTIRSKIRNFFEKINKKIIANEERRKFEYAEFLAKQKQERTKQEYEKQIRIQRLLNDYHNYLELGYCPLCSRFVNSYNKLYYDEKRFVVFCDACQREDATRNLLAGAIFLNMFDD